VLGARWVSPDLSGVKLPLHFPAHNLRGDFLGPCKHPVPLRPVLPHSFGIHSHPQETFISLELQKGDFLIVVPSAILI
jgi:hypothetical protein